MTKKGAGKGSGKTTTPKISFGFLTPRQAEVMVAIFIFAVCIIKFDPKYSYGSPLWKAYGYLQWIAWIVAIVIIAAGGIHWFYAEYKKNQNKIEKEKEKIADEEVNDAAKLAAKENKAAAEAKKNNVIRILVALYTTVDPKEPEEYARFLAQTGWNELIKNEQIDFINSTEESLAIAIYRSNQQGQFVKKQ